MNENGGQSSWCQAVDPANLTEILGLCPFETLYHLVRQPADRTKLKTLRDDQRIVMVYAFCRQFLFLNVAAIKRVCQRSVKIGGSYLMPYIIWEKPYK